MANNTKRKRSAEEVASDGMETQQTKKAKTRPYKPRKMPDGRSLLLELPPEIRLSIYELVNSREEVSAVAHHGVIIDKSPFLRVSKKIRQEYEGLLYTKANIQATVKDFDFSHLVRLLNRMEENEFRTLIPAEATVRRKFVITISITNDCPANPENLHTWLYRFDDETKRGHQVAFKYKFEGKMSTPCPGSGWMCRHHSCAGKTRERPRALKQKMNDQWLPNMPKGRLRHELKKICRALKGDIVAEP